MKIGVLSLQGAVTEHLRMIENAGATAIEIKRVDQLDQLDGIVLPGGESTTIGKLMRQYGFIEALQDFSGKGKPIFGTCAGLILMAKKIAGQDEIYLGLMEIEVERNAFGRQRESFEANIAFSDWNKAFPAVFIRAPRILSTGPDVKVLTAENGRISAAVQGRWMVTAFHPELTRDDRIHRFFIAMVQEFLDEQSAVESK